MYSGLPSAPRVTVPCSGWVKPMMLSGSPSTSVSLRSTGMEMGVSSEVLTRSLTATGASLTGVTSTLTVAVTGVRPSVAVYVKLRLPL